MLCMSHITPLIGSQYNNNVKSDIINKMTRGEIRTEILVRSGKDTTSAWTSEAFLNDWVNQAHKWAGGYKPWVFTEGRTSTTWASVEELNFEGYKADSFRLLQIGGKRLTKLNFEDYQIFREEEASGTDRVFSDFGRLVFALVEVGLMKKTEEDTLDDFKEVYDFSIAFDSKFVFDS